MLWTIIAPCKRLLVLMFGWMRPPAELTIQDRAKRLGVEIDGDPRTITYILSVEESYFRNPQL